MIPHLIIVVVIIEIVIEIGKTSFPLIDVSLNEDLFFSDSFRGPRRYDSMPSRYEQPSYNNRSSFQSNFSQPPPPFDEARSSNRSTGNNKNANRSSQNSIAPPPPPSAAPPQPPPPPPIPMPDIYQSMYRQYYDMYMQQATANSK